MKLVVTLTKEIADELEAIVLTQLIKTKLAEHPDIKIESYVHNKIDS